MTSLQIFAFFILPVLVLVLAIVAVWLNDWDLKRRDRMHPGE